MPTLTRLDCCRHRGNHGPIDAPLCGTSVAKRNARRNLGLHIFVNPDLPDDASAAEICP